MVGTCLDPPLWSDLKTKDERTGRCERKEKLTICAMPPSSKDTVFTQAYTVKSCQIKIKIFFSQIARVAPHVYLSAATALTPAALEGLALTLVSRQEKLFSFGRH